MGRPPRSRRDQLRDAARRGDTQKGFEAATLADDVIAAELRLAEVQLAAKRPQATSGTRVADVLRLAKAMPSSADQPGLVLELDRLGRSTGVTIGSITPRDPALGTGGATTIPVAVHAYDDG